MKFQLHKVLDTTSQSKILAEVIRNSHMFGLNPIRTDHPGSAHREVVDILLRGPVEISTLPFTHGTYSAPTVITKQLHNDLECLDYKELKKFPCIVKILLNTIKLFRALNGRVIITQLAPGGVIYPHVDEGAVPEYYRRFHYVIQDGGRDVFMVDDCAQVMLTGQLWEVDVKQKHCCVNMGNKDRIHLIMDFH